MILQSMLLSLAMLGQGSYDINEQQINQYLQSQVQVNKQLELPGIIKAHVQLEQSDVQIGRQSPDTARVYGKGKLKIALPDQTEYDARLNMTYEARPRYDKAQSALVLEKVVSEMKGRISARTMKETQRRKTALESSSLPAKLVDCRSNSVENSELFIVEGDSGGDLFIVSATEDTADLEEVEVVNGNILEGTEVFLTRLQRGQFFGQKFFLTRRAVCCV
jgi:hypothetical protein